MNFSTYTTNVVYCLLLYDTNFHIIVVDMQGKTGENPVRARRRKARYRSLST